MKISLGKFFAENSDLPTLINGIAFLLRLVTLNIDMKYKKGTPFISYMIVVTAFLCYIYVYIFSMLWFVLIRSTETQDYATAAVVLSLGLGSLTCVSKAIFMVIYKKNMQNLVQQYLDYDARLRPGTTFHARLHKQMPKIKQRVVTVWSTLIFILIVYVWVPIILPGRNFPENLYIIYGLEPMFETPNYEIALTMMTLGITVTVYTMTCTIAFILTIIGYIEAQMLALSEEMSGIWEEAREKYEEIKDTNCNTFISDNIVKKYVNEYIHKRLKDVIEFHIANIIFLNTFEKLFRVTMALDFIFTITAIVAELLGGIENTYLEIPYSFLQLYINCYMGQKLLDSSNEFESSVYNCKWENFDKANRRMVLLILTNSQKPLALTAGGLTVLDYVCLMSVIKSTYTIYTTLQSCLK